MKRVLRLRHSTDVSSSVDDIRSTETGESNSTTLVDINAPVTDDYRNFLSQLNNVDLILTDPPYAISKDSGFAHGKLDKLACYKTDFGSWDHDEIDLDALALQSYSALRTGGTIIVFYDYWKITNVKDALSNAGFKMLRLIEWAKTNPVPVNSKRFYLSNSREVAIAAVKCGKPTFNAEYHSGRYFYPIPRHNGNRIHPTQKSDDLFEELILIHTRKGDLVADPFLGGGTTAIAAENTNRRWVGCDIDEAYVLKVKERLCDNRR